MSEMVERVARAIAKSYDDGEPCSIDFNAARAAIEAMREPNCKICDAIESVTDGRTDHMWVYAIDAALAP